MILSLATTVGLRCADRSLAEGISRLGASCKVIEVEIGAGERLKRGMLLTDMVEARAARRTLIRALEAEKPRAVIISTVTAAMLQPKSFWQKYKTAIKFDSPASLNRPGLVNSPQHRLERLALDRADLLLPLGNIAMKEAGNEGKSVVLPPPVEVEPGPEQRDRLVVAYAGNPKKRGLDILNAAWRSAGFEDARLVVTGIDEKDALKWLSSCGAYPAGNVEYTGLVARERFLELLREACVFVNASRWEDFGSAQLEALGAGALLVTLPTPGANEALPLARRLSPELVAPNMRPEELAGSLRAAMQIDRVGQTRYRKQAEELLAPFRSLAVQRTIRESLLPRLLDS